MSGKTLIKIIAIGLQLIACTYAAEPQNEIFSSTRFFDALSSEEREYLGANPLLKVCNVTQASQSNASLDITSLITQGTALRLIASKPYAWKQALEGLQKGDCDILPWATKTEERLLTMNFTQPYAEIIQVIITRHEQPYINDIGLYTDLVFITESDNAVIDQLQAKYPEFKNIRAEKTSQLFDFVIDKKAFGSISALYSVGNLFNKETPFELKIAGKLPREFNDSVTLATRKEDAILNSILNKAISYSDKKAIEAFISGGAIFEYDPNVIDSKSLWAAALLIVLVILLLWWNRHLRQLNHQLSKTHAELQEKTNELEILSVTDPLTTAFNRLKIDRVFADEIARSERYGQPLSICMIDIDHYKSVNDNYGHLIGDIVLSKFALILKDNLRTHDVLGRWGGEEFLVICPQTTIGEAQITAEKLRRIIENNDFSPVDNITASFGVTQWHPGETQEMLISKADYAMYLSKHQGRNKVNVSSSQSDLQSLEDA